MKSSEGFQIGEKADLANPSRNEREAQEAMSFEVENERLERENTSLRQQISEIKKKITENVVSKRVLDTLYLVGTNPNILMKSLVERLDSEKDLKDIVADLERQRLENDFAIKIIEPSRIAQELVVRIRWNFKVTDETREITEEAINKIIKLTGFSSTDVRKLIDVLGVIPPEHLSKSVQTIEKTPVKDVIKLLGEFAEKLSFVADRDSVNEIKLLQDRLTKEMGTVGAYINAKEKQVAFCTEFSDLFGWRLIHETGHGVYANLLSDQEKAKWSAICRSSVTAYGRGVAEEHQANENFSEMYALYLLNRPLYQLLALADQEFAEQYRFFQQLMPMAKTSMPHRAGILLPLGEWLSEKNR